MLAADGRPVALMMCVNIDVSHFHGVLGALDALVSVPAQEAKHPLLFKEDWHERIAEFVQQWTRSPRPVLTSLMRDQKRELVANLSRQGAFGRRNAAAHISRIPGMARATVYTYLKQAAAAAEVTQALGADGAGSACSSASLEARAASIAKIEHAASDIALLALSLTEDAAARAAMTRLASPTAARPPAQPPPASTSRTGHADRRDPQSGRAPRNFAISGLRR